MLEADVEPLLATRESTAGTRPRVLVITARGWYRHLSHSIVVDFEDAMSELADVTWHHLPADAMEKGLPTRSEIAIPDEGPYDLALFVAMAPSWLRALRGLGGLKRAATRLAVYVFDAWPYHLRALWRWKRQVRWIDHLFVAYPEAVGVYQPKLSCPVHYLVQGTSVSRFRPDEVERPLHVLSVGRRHGLAHRRLLSLAERDNLLYVFPDRVHPWAGSLDDTRYLTGALSRASRVHVSWPVEFTSPARSAGYSPVTARWFETAACAAVALGRKPVSATFDELFPYDGYVIDLQPDGPDFERVVHRALDLDDARQRQELAAHTRLNHSWQRRCEAILSTTLS